MCKVSFCMSNVLLFWHSGCYHHDVNPPKKHSNKSWAHILQFYSWLSYTNTPCSKYVCVQITFRNLSLVNNAIVCTSLSINPRFKPLLIIIIQLKLLFFLCPFRSGREKNQNTPSCGTLMALQNQNYYVQNLLVKCSQAPSLANLKSTFPGGKDGCIMA